MKIAAIIPAYNEEKTIGEVLGAIRQVELIDESIVVDDGSRDRTADIARHYGSKVIILPENRGKGGAIKAGIEQSDADVVLLLDADLLGLTPYHVFRLLEPVIFQGADMAIGVFRHGRISTDLAQWFAPWLSGQRAVKRNFILGISELETSRFGVELVLSRHALRHHAKVVRIVLPDLSHVMKEEKYGLYRGFIARIRMYWEIAKVMGRGAKQVQ